MAIFVGLSIFGYSEQNGIFGLILEDWKLIFYQARDNIINIEKRFSGAVCNADFSLYSEIVL